MEIDFEEIIVRRKKTLRKRIEDLDNSIKHLSISSPIEFDVSEIQSDYNPRKKGKKVGVEALNFLEEVRDSVVYVFQIKDLNSIEIVKESFKKYRLINNKSDKRAVSYLPANIDSNMSNTLYVGSKKEGFHRRIKEHLGLGNFQTGALNLKFWIPENVRLQLYYVPLQEESLTYDIEASIAKELKPLIGKCEK